MGGFGERLLYAMERRGMTQSALARASGVPQGSISRYLEQDRTPARVWELAFALGYRAEWLATGEGPEEGLGLLCDPDAATLNFAERLRGARRDAGFPTPQAAAKAAAIEPARCAAFEMAKAWPGASEMLVIMQTLRISLNYLIAGVGLPGPETTLRVPDSGFLHEKATSKER